MPSNVVTPPVQNAQPSSPPLNDPQSVHIQTESQCQPHDSSSSVIITQPTTHTTSSSATSSSNSSPTTPDVTIPSGYSIGSLNSNNNTNSSYQHNRRNLFNPRYFTRRHHHSSTTSQNRTLRSPSSYHTFLHRPLDRLLCIYLLAIISITIYFRVRHDCTETNRRLCTWLVVNAVITFVRVTGWIIIHAIPPDARLSIVRQMLIWTFRIINITAFIWFIVGVVFLNQTPSVSDGNSNTDESNDSPNATQPSGNGKEPIRALVTAIIVIELIIIVLSIILGIAIFLFALRPILLGRYTPQGATKEQIDKLPTFTYSPNQNVAGNNNDNNNQNNNHSDTDLQSCIICLEDYKEGEVLKELPCSSNRHVFHARCIDEWLIQNSSCPICRDNPFRERGEEDEKEDDGNSNNEDENKDDNDANNDNTTNQRQQSETESTNRTEQQQQQNSQSEIIIIPPTAPTPTTESTQEIDEDAQNV